MKELLDVSNVIFPFNVSLSGAALSIDLHDEINNVKNSINHFGARTTSNPCDEFQKLCTIDSSVSEKDKQKIQNYIDAIKYAKMDITTQRALAEIRDQIIKCNEDYGNDVHIVFKTAPTGTLEDSTTHATLGATTAYEVSNPHNFIITLDLITITNHSTSTEVLNAFKDKFVSYNSGGIFDSKPMGFFMHELGHVYSDIAFPPSNPRTKLEENRSECHAQRMEAHYYRTVTGFGAPFSESDYKYLNDNPYSTFLSLFSFYNYPYIHR